ncbi:MAG: hypothetical protein D6731_23885 [Planctomycetota bacterium]|nr:MAG: hypothetical protein D6731_23885 [Planctomycetota bacterium]
MAEPVEGLADDASAGAGDGGRDAARASGAPYAGGGGPRWPRPRWVLAWGALWLGTFGVWQLLLVPAGFGHYGRSWGGGLFFGLATLLGLLLHRQELPSALRWPGRGPPLAVAAAAALTWGAARWVAVRWPVTPEALAPYRALRVGLVLLDGRYFLAKLPELCFQQALIYVLVRRLAGHGFRGLRLVGAFALVFGGVHLPILWNKGWAGAPFLGAALGASLVFPPLIARFRGGVAYSFCVHLLAYVLAGTLLRVRGL